MFCSQHVHDKKKKKFKIEKKVTELCLHLKEYVLVLADLDCKIPRESALSC